MPQHTEKKEESLWAALMRLLGAPQAAMDSAARGGAPAPQPTPGFQDMSYVKKQVEETMKAKAAAEAARRAGIRPR